MAPAAVLRQEGHDDQKYLCSTRRPAYRPTARPMMLNMTAVAKPTQLPTHQPSQLPMVAPTKARRRDKGLAAARGAEKVDHRDAGSRRDQGRGEPDPKRA